MKHSLNFADLRSHLERHRAVPVVAGDFPARTCVELAQSLLAGGVKVMERPLRGSNVEEILRGIRDVRREVPAMIIGAGTITSPDLLKEAMDAGAEFGVSPGGISGELHEEIQSRQFPFIPGVLAENSLEGSQVADLDTARRMSEMGYRDLKWFNAVRSGGVEGLRTFAVELPKARWIPMGSIDEVGVQAYLDIPGVLCTGGSWIAPLDHIQNGRWDEIRELAKMAVRR